MEDLYEPTCTVDGCTNTPYRSTKLCRKHYEARSSWMNHTFDDRTGCWVVKHQMTELQLRVVFFLWNDRQARTDRVVSNDPFRCRFRNHCVNPMHVIEQTAYEARTFV